MFTTETTQNVQIQSIVIDGKALDNAVDTQETTSLRFTELNFIGGGYGGLTQW